MAIRKFDRKGYGQLEPSQVWFTRAGMSESQCELDPDSLRHISQCFPLKLLIIRFMQRLALF